MSLTTSLPSLGDRPLLVTSRSQCASDPPVMRPSAAAPEDWLTQTSGALPGARCRGVGFGSRVCGVVLNVEERHGGADQGESAVAGIGGDDIQIVCRRRRANRGDRRDVIPTTPRATSSFTNMRPAVLSICTPPNCGPGTEVVCEVRHLVDEEVNIALRQRRRQASTSRFVQQRLLKRGGEHDERGSRRLNAARAIVVVRDPQVPRGIEVKPFGLGNSPSCWRSARRSCWRRGWLQPDCSEHERRRP